MINFKNESAFLENQRNLKMELAKITAFFTGFINIFLYVSAWFANLDNIKSTILFVVALLMSMYRFWRWRKTSIQNEILKNIMIEREQIINDQMRADINNPLKKVSK